MELQSVGRAFQSYRHYLRAIEVRFICPQQWNSAVDFDRMQFVLKSSISYLTMIIIRSVFAATQFSTPRSSHWSAFVGRHSIDNGDVKQA